MTVWSPGLVHLIAQFNLGVLMARQAYDESPHSTHRQRPYTPPPAKEPDE